MLKKIISFLLVICTLGCFAYPSFAAKENDTICVKLSSDISGCTCYDADKLIEIKSADVVLKSSDPITTANYAGTHVSEALKAGRTYYIYYELVAAEGYTLPDQLTKDDIDIQCQKGVKVISAQTVSAKIRDNDGSFSNYKGLMIFAQVKVYGTFLQNIAGSIYDIYLKIKAWSLY